MQCVLNSSKQPGVDLVFLLAGLKEKKKSYTENKPTPGMQLAPLIEDPRCQPSKWAPLCPRVWLCAATERDWAPLKPGQQPRGWLPVPASPDLIQANVACFGFGQLSLNFSPCKGFPLQPVHQAGTNPPGLSSHAHILHHHRALRAVPTDRSRTLICKRGTGEVSAKAMSAAPGRRAARRSGQGSSCWKAALALLLLQRCK